MATQDPTVSICIPAYQSEEFIVDTLEAVQKQTYENLQVLISVDPSADNTETVCRRFASDDRFSVTPQHNRLGWAGNMNYLLGRVQTDYFIILPNDDLIDEQYVELLLAEFEVDPELINVYSDIDLFGEVNQRFTMNLGTGTPFERMLHFISGSSSGIPQRGLTRSSMIHDGLRFRENQFNSYLADIAYVFELIGRGRCRRLARPLYRKWVRPGSVERSEFVKWTREQQLVAWVEHTSACIDVLNEFDFDPYDRYALLNACLIRCLRKPHVFGGQAKPSEAGAGEEFAVLSALMGRLLGLEAVRAEQIEKLAAMFTQPTPALPIRKDRTEGPYFKLKLESFTPSRMKCSETIAIDVAIENRLTCALTSDPPYPLHLSYRWLSAREKKSLGTEGLRAPLIPPLAPNMKSSYTMQIEAPPAPGPAILRLCLVQERVQWFDNPDYGECLDFQIDVDAP